MNNILAHTIPWYGTAGVWDMPRTIRPSYPGPGGEAPMYGGAMNPREAPMRPPGTTPMAQMSEPTDPSNQHGAAEPHTGHRGKQSSTTSQTLLREPSVSSTPARQVRRLQSTTHFGNRPSTAVQSGGRYAPTEGTGPRGQIPNTAARGGIHTPVERARVDMTAKQIRWEAWQRRARGWGKPTGSRGGRFQGGGGLRGAGMARGMGR